MSEDELKIQISELQDALQQALEAGLVYKANAEEGAARVEVADRRIYELERNRELFQQQRDEAIKERDLARKIADAAAKNHPLIIEIERIEPKPGDLFVLRLAEHAEKSELEVFSSMLRWLTRRYSQNTFISFGKGVDPKLERVSETDLRTMGLISVKRVDAGIAQLEAAFGAQQTAITKAAQAIGMLMIPGEMTTSVREQVDTLLVLLNKLLAVELKPEERPTSGQLIELLRKCRPVLKDNITTKDQEYGIYAGDEIELVKQIDALIGEGT